jgi:HemY protein
MIRGLWFFAQLAVLVLAAVWIAGQQGAVSVEWHRWRLETSTGILILIVVVAALAVILLWRIWRSVVGAPHAISRFRHRRRRNRGYVSLVHSLAALASGEGVTALRHASEAEAIGEPALAHLAAAEAAEMAGDIARADEEYKRLAGRPDTMMIGLRGLTGLAERQGDLVQALAHARQARKLAPKSPWAVAKLFELEERTGALDGAERTLADAIKLGAVSPTDADRMLAHLLLSRARMTAASGNESDALKDAERAHQLDPALTEAAIVAARLLARSGRTPAAERILTRSWTSAPDVELARAWLGLVPKGDVTARLKQAERLMALNRDSDEGRLALAEAELATGRWAEARTHLSGLGSPLLRGSERFCRLMAYLESASGNEAAARDWFEKSLATPDAVPAPALQPAA